MFGPLLRRSILQGSASRTWNYLINFTHLLWCKLKYIRELRLKPLGYEFWYLSYDATHSKEALHFTLEVAV
ncbi:unnamed protein product [Arctia plantaginis]|uniref:Uncharacterized protein n=1 Tax=Arctia plantaginis TaxID=874455 RepID=A0A8S1AQ99_ARCPL|nr:unnamed protein product [Arctia plantaginis]CAB3250431.1 unnamed protein product [Arctia plantaginis]